MACTSVHSRQISCTQFDGHSIPQFCNQISILTLFLVLAHSTDGLLSTGQPSSATASAWKCWYRVVLPSTFKSKWGRGPGIQYCGALLFSLLIASCWSTVFYSQQYDWIVGRNTFKHQDHVHCPFDSVHTIWNHFAILGCLRYWTLCKTLDASAMKWKQCQFACMPAMHQVSEWLAKFLQISLSWYKSMLPYYQDGTQMCKNQVRDSKVTLLTIWLTVWWGQLVHLNTMGMSHHGREHDIANANCICLS